MAEVSLTPKLGALPLFGIAGTNLRKSAIRAYYIRGLGARGVNEGYQYKSRKGTNVALFQTERVITSYVGSVNLAPVLTRSHHGKNFTSPLLVLRQYVKTPIQGIT